MLDTSSPGIIYDVFDKAGFPIQRIDHFESGRYAEIRAELSYSRNLSILQLQELTMKLSLLEKNENLRIEVVNIDMIHHSIRLNIHTRETSRREEPLKTHQ